MGLKSTLKLILLFCTLNMILNQQTQYTLSQGNPVILNTPNKIGHPINVQGELKKYISLVLTPENPKAINPTIIISLTSGCHDRLAMSIQNLDSSYLFIKSKQIKNNKFYVCIDAREKKVGDKSFKVEIKDDEVARLPFGKQTNYLVKEDSKDMEFNICLPDNKTEANYNQISIWIRGRSVKTDDINFPSSYESKTIDGGIIFYGEFNGEEQFEVSSKDIDDYITVGSVRLNDGVSLEELKINGNELIAATSGELCFPVNYTEEFSCISGKIHTLTGVTFFANSRKDGLTIQGTEISNEVRDGIFADYNIIQPMGLKIESGLYCIRPLDGEPTDTVIIATLQSVSFDNTPLATPPVYPGEIRRYIMLKGRSAIFYGLTPTPKFNESNYNMKSLKGFPDMYFEEVKTFPNINFPKIGDKYSGKGEKVIPSNRISVYSFYRNDDTKYDKLNSIENIQPLMIVHCADGVRPEGQTDDLFCEFEVTFFTNEDTIKMIEESTFSQYLDTNEIDNYRIKIPSDFEGGKIYLDLTIFTGDADIKIDSYDGVVTNKYYLSNKVFFSVHCDKTHIENLDFKVKGNSKVFYMVNYQLIYKNEKEDKNSLESGINYITSKSTEDSNNLMKTIYLSNFKAEHGQPYMATFYSPNCKFSLGMRVSRGLIKPINVIDNYAYVVLTKEDDSYYSKNSNYLFNYKIEEDDDSKYAKKFCMVYVAGIELNEKVKSENPKYQDSFNGRTISLSEGVPHIFNYANDLPVAYYTYYISDTKNHLIINLNLLDKATFKVRVKIKEKEYHEYDVYRTQQIYIKSDDIKEICKQELEVCTVQVNITMLESTRDRKVEITMYQLDNLPMYLEKNKVKNDIINGYWSKHYYFDIAKNQYSDITLDYKRGSGFIFADIQDRKLKTPMKDAEWRGIYKFPTEKGKLGYRTYGKKLIITTEDTENCVNGCYVLITVMTNFDIIKQEDYGKYPMRISLNTRVMSSNEEKDSPKVKISVNDFIIGDIFFAPINNRRYDYYQVTLPFDSDSLQIDWQADSPTLLINVGIDRPTEQVSHFRYPSMGDFVYKISKSEILQRGGLDQNRGLRGVILTIGIFAQVSDSLESSPYAFKLFLPPILLKEEQISAEVIHIRSDQKVQCSPFYIEKNSSLCIFAVIFDDMDIASNLVVYPRITNGKIFRKYGTMFEAEKVEKNDMVEVIKKTFQTYQETNSEIKGDFVYEINVDKSQSYLLIVEVENAAASTIVDVLSSTYQYTNGTIINPNPSTAQIFAIGKNTINLYFATRQDLILNIASVSGIGAFTWYEKYGNNQTVYLNGIGDRVSLTTYSILVDSTDLPVLEIQSLADINVSPSGFIFYITYYPRGYVDALKPNRINEIHYRTTKMPLSYYVPIDFIQSWTVNLNFYVIEAKESEERNKQRNFFTYENSLFDIWGTILDDQQLFLARFIPDHQPQPTDDKIIKGAFDLIYGTIFFSAENINKIMPPSSNKTPNIYVKVQASKENNGLVFNRIGLEADAHSIAKEFGEDAVPEGVYISGRNLYGIRMYKLKLNKDKPAFKLEYSANSNFVKFALTKNLSSPINDEFKGMQLRDESGRKVLNLTFDADYLAKNEYLYLMIYLDQNRDTGEDDKLNYFVFKYVTSFNPLGFLPIKELTTNDVKYERRGEDWTIKFTPVKYPEVSYFIKAIYTEDIVLGENINSIAMSESKGMNLIANENGNNNQQSEISYTLKPKKDVMYIKVVAMLSVLEEKLIYLYNPIDLSEDQQSQISYLEKMDKPQTFHVPTKSKIKIARLNSANKKQKYEVIFDGQDKVLDYVKVEVSTDLRIDSPNVCFSNQDQDCMYYRGQLSLGGGYSTIIYVKKEQFINKKFYLTVECHDAAKCSYNITISKENEAYFDSFGTYNYFVSENNTNMIFKFRNIFVENNFTLTAYATGGKNIGLKLDDCFDSACNQYNFTDGAAITVSTNKLDYYILTVNADPGDYISVGLKLFEGKSALGLNLSPERGQISGMLRKNVLDMECFALPTQEDTYYLTGNIYDGFAFFGYADDKMEQNQNDWVLATKGYFSLVYDYPKNKRVYMCITFSGMAAEEKYLSYSLQIQSKKTFNSALYTPQYNSFIYSRAIPVGKTAFFNGILPKVESEYMVYNMFTTEGYPKMYVYLCETYPSCEIAENLEDGPKIKHITEINRHSSIFVPTNLMGKTPIDSTQVLLVVKCNEAQGKEKYEYCEFSTSIYGEKDVVQLINNQPFGQYDTPNDTDQFLIDFSLETAKNFKVHIDFLVVTGDVNFIVKNAESGNEDISVHKYYLANKIFYSIEIDREKNINANLRKIRIDTKARLDSYYVVEYKIVGSQVEQMINRIYTNINYLIPISPKRDIDNEQKKVLILQSVKIIHPEVTVYSFYSLNCKFQIKKYINDTEAEQIPSYGNYGQDFYNHTLQDLNIPYILTEQGYIAYIQDSDKYFLNDNDMCMLYVSGIELYPEDSGIRKEILISEGVPQKFIFFEGIKKIRYVYPHVDPKKNLTYHLNMIIPGKLKVRMFFREKEYNMEKEYTQSGIFFIYNNWIQAYCLEEDELCSVTIEIENEADFRDNFPQIEFTIKQVKNTPYYVPRGVQRRDYITNDAYLFLYTDIGKSNSGYLTVDFNRGSGYVYARIVKIDQKESDKNPDWRNYAFLREKSEQDLYYDMYNKKIEFTANESKDCDNGCYILITVTSSVLKQEVGDFDFQTFNYIADFNPEVYKEKKVPQKKIEIYPEEYVIGSLFLTDESDKNNVFEYYTMSIPYDADEIEIDWQTNIAQLYINVGEIRPNLNSHHFPYPNRGNSIIVIKRDEILKKYREIYPNDLGTSLSQIVLTIGVFTQFYETFGFTQYAFKIHLQRTYDLNIYKVTSDQKTLCTPDDIGGQKFRCIFIIIYQDTELFNDLIVYAKSKDPSAVINMYGDYVDSTVYDSYDIEKLKLAIPTAQKARYNTEKDKTNFLFLEYGDFKSHAIISVVSDIKKEMEFYSSFKTFEDLLMPNPSSAQIYSMDIFRKSLVINFMTRKSVSVNIRSLYGEGRFQFQNDPDNTFYLRGEEDNLNYIIPGSDDNDQKALTLLTIENLRYNNPNYKNPGYAFILEFFLRTPELEVDSVSMDETKEVVYKQADTPVFFYVDVLDPTKDVMCYFYLHDLVYDNNELEKRIIANDEMEFKGAVVSKTDIYMIKNNMVKIPNLAIKGFYDPTLKAGVTTIPKSYYSSDGQSTIFMALTKSDKALDLKYKSFRGEIGFSTINGNSVVTQKLYQFGKLENKDSLITYKLHTNSKISNYVRIQFSANSKFVNFAISQEPAQKKNETFAEFAGKRERGVVFVTFKRPEKAEYLYLTVFADGDSGNNKLYNYVFKYINALSKDLFFEYKIVSNNPKVEVQSDNQGKINVTFYPIDFQQSAGTLDINILYTVKIIKKNALIPNEKSDHIAITQSEYEAAQQFKLNGLDKKTVEINKIVNDYDYAQVIATITQGSIIEYVAYQAVKPKNILMEPDSNPKPGESGTTTTGDGSGGGNGGKAGLYVIIGVSCFLLVVVVALVIVIVMYNSKNKDLLTQVNKISFVQSGASPINDDANLLLDNQNELD